MRQALYGRCAAPVQARAERPRAFDLSLRTSAERDASMKISSCWPMNSGTLSRSTL